MKDYLKGSNDYFKRRALNTQDRTDMNYKHFVEMVQVAGGYRCAICHTLDRIEVHHKEAFENAPELRVEVSNGVLLCSNHHKAYHKEYPNIKDVNTKTLTAFFKKNNAELQ